MHTATRTILMAAIGAAMIVPIAHAQGIHAGGQAVAQLQAPPLPPAVPPPVNDADRVDTPMTPPTTAQGAVHAQAHSSIGQRDAWAKLDLDHDGRISATEANVDAAFNTRFGDMDSNHDGFISDAEYRAFAKADMDTSQGAAHAAGHSAVVTRDTFGKLDADADGRISASEAGADADFNGMFSAMDADGDGFVTSAEFRAHGKADTP